ncbi:MAG: hypothetical protein HY710_16960 [Candidatus Latescibacteria bacterium]|nr:hypothetical protein [Candidatus Latescibacterota bacterium]
MRSLLSAVGHFLLALMAAATPVACNTGNTLPLSKVPVTLSFKAATSPSSGGQDRATLSITDGNHNVVQIATVELVLRTLSFKRAYDDSAKDHVEMEPFLVCLPLDATKPVIASVVSLPAGSWDEVELEVYNRREAPIDTGFLQTTDFPDGVSVRVTGTWTSAGRHPVPFTFTTDLNEKQQIMFDLPIVAVHDTVNNETFIVDLNRWFRDARGVLVDPRSANTGGRNENLVKDNIRASITGFEDDNRDGIKD